jgi:membrane protease YdiL (CAAX protease family)
MKFQKATLITVLYYLLVEFVGLWVVLVPDELHFLGLIKASHLITSFIILIFVRLILRSIKKSETLKLKSTNPKYFIISLVLGIGFVFFQSVLNIFYYQEVPSKLFDYQLSFGQLASLSVLASILVVPITEELVFRNYILNDLLNNYKPLAALVLSSLLFAFVHIPFISLFYEFMDFSLHQAYIAIFGGFISGVFFYKSKSVFPSIIFHLSWNLGSYILW